MTADFHDTIVAIATAPGRAGIGVLRVSGPGVPAIARALLGRVPAPRRAELQRFCAADGETLDVGLALHFPGPNSYTGEDVLELQGHGGPVLLDLLLARVLELGARAARPGEFTQRAFLNEKIDLAQAEAVADLIDSGSQAAARAALRSLQGEFSERVHELGEAILQLRMWIEAAIDFPEEEIDFLADPALAERLHDVRARFVDLEGSAGQGVLLREGLTLVIAGRPNAGKSSLLNRLAGYEAAIVTPHPGTTRDVLRERIEIDGLPLHLLDTAGLRESQDPVEREGIRRAQGEIARADRVLFLVDSSDATALRALDADLAALPRAVPVTVLLTKADLSGAPTGPISGAPPRLALSTHSGAGLEALREHLKECVGYRGDEGGALSARRRHLDALRRAQVHVERGARLFEERRAGELVAQELTDAQRELGEITGQVSSDELLGRIFQSFCIGK